MANDKRTLAVVLLLFSCITSSLLLWKAEPPNRTTLTSSAQLDSLINLTINDFMIPQSNVRMRSVKVDSLFTRNIYSIRVPRDFSKTSFHYQLHQELLPFNASTAGRVEFPDYNLQIHVIFNNKVHRSVFIITDPLLQQIHQ